MGDEEYRKWRNLIGDFFIEFTHVESELDYFIIDLCPKEYEIISNEIFKRKASFILKNIDHFGISEEVNKKTKRAINELLVLGESVRNVIAHNPLTLSLESLFEKEPRSTIVSNRNKRYEITLKSLEKSYESLLHWSDEFQQAAYKVSCELYP